MKHCRELLSSRRGSGILLVWLAFACGGITEPPIGAAEVVTYEQVRNVLVKRCGNCHAGSRLRGDLDLSSWSGIQSGSVSGPVVFAGRPEESLLYTLSAHFEAPKMPPNSSRIPQSELDLLHAWIAGGLQREGGIAPGRPALGRSAQTMVRPFPRHSAFTALALSPEGDLVAASGVQQVLLFDSESGEPLRAFSFDEGDVHSLKFTPDGQVLLAAGGIGAEAGYAIGFDSTSGDRLFKVGQEADVVLAVDCTADQNLVAVGGPGRVVNLYDPASGQRLRSLKRHTDWILCLAFSPDGLLLASGDRFGGLHVWEAASGVEFHSLRGHTAAVTAVRWLGTSDHLLSVSEDGTARLWDMHTGDQLSAVDIGGQGILAADIDREQRLFVGGRGGLLASLSRSGEMRVSDPLPSQVVELAVNAAGTKLAVATVDGQLDLYSPVDLTRLTSLRLPLIPERTVAEVLLPPARIRPESQLLQEVIVPSSPVELPAAGASSGDDLAQLLREVRSATALLRELRDTTARCEQRLVELEARLAGVEQSATHQPEIQ